MFAEDLTAFLSDFGVLATYKGGIYRVLFDIPGQDILSSRVASNQYEMTYIVANMPSLSFGEQVSIAGKGYTVLSTNDVDDGVFARAIVEAN